MITNMKYKIGLAAMAVALLTGCDDQIMEWGTPEGHGEVTAAELPLQVKEVLANYANIKEYAAQYTPNMTIGLGIGASIYTDDTDPRQALSNDNFQMITLGNAMKHDAIVTNAGGLNFSNVDNVIAAMPEGMKLYGHNFFWYQQTRQAYLKSLIAPTLVVESDSDIKSILNDDSSDFEGGNTGSWGSWGNSSTKDVGNEGYNSDHSMHLTNPSDANFWSAQCAYDVDGYLDTEVEYTIRFYAKSNTGAGKLQFQYQNGSTYGSQGAYTTFDVGTDWVLCETSFTPAYDDVNRIIINFGQVAGEYWIDKIEFGVKQEDPMDNILAGDSHDFEGGSTGSWGSWGNGSSKDVAEEGYNSDHSMHLNNPSDANFWSAQCAYDVDGYLENGKKYIIQFYAKSSSASGQLQFQYQNGSTYDSQGAYNTFNVGTDWVLCEHEFTVAYDDVNRILINFGQVAADYYVDNIKFGLAKDQSTEAKGARMVKFVKGKPRKAKSYYVLKSDAEKREALLAAMEAWVKGMANHLAEKGVVPAGYDVINEAITDGNGNKVRGVDNVFGGSDTDDDGNTTYDSAPVETEENGLELNWGNNRFYWGYYVPDYGVKAFQYARQYLPAETKLFINDYNLETSPSKLAALVNWVKSIDDANGTPIVDGIGTQMHVSFSPTDDVAANAEKLATLKSQIDAQFKTLAATGKLIRVTELDISVNSESPSSAQYQAQADAYRIIFESYKENIPTAQQSGITIWSLTDADDEHEYWLKGQKPNLFDANYLRKWAYKGVCDGIAGEDLGLKYGGEDYKAYYDKQNVSETVK